MAGFSRGQGLQGPLPATLIHVNAL